MYYPNDIEDMCYENKHIEQVLTEIKSNFYNYFRQFVETESGQILERETIKEIAEKIGANFSNKNKRVDIKKICERIIDEGIKSYEEDRQKYLSILDFDALTEYEDDPSYFKNTILKNKCPVIHNTLQNKAAKELDKYRESFQLSDPGELLKVTSNITKFAFQYKKERYSSSAYEGVNTLTDLMFSDLQNEEYFVHGVIGGGIKSYFLFKLFPSIFPNRSRESIWALWYLTSKKSFDCKEDSEFLMLYKDDDIAHQNFYYPYDLFSFYALKLFLLLKEETSKATVIIPNEYRYVFLDSFLSFIAQCNQKEISELEKRINDYGY